MEMFRQKSPKNKTQDLIDTIYKSLLQLMGDALPVVYENLSHCIPDRNPHGLPKMSPFDAQQESSIRKKLSELEKITTLLNKFQLDLGSSIKFHLARGMGSLFLRDETDQTYEDFFQGFKHFKAYSTPETIANKVIFGTLLGITADKLAQNERSDMGYKERLEATAIEAYSVAFDSCPKDSRLKKILEETITRIKDFPLFSPPSPLDLLRRS